MAARTQVMTEEQKAYNERIENYRNSRTVALQLINNRELIDALLALDMVLQTVRDVFGEENMTEDVMTKAIEAWSYLGYRNVMGLK